MKKRTISTLKFQIDLSQIDVGVFDYFRTWLSQKGYLEVSSQPWVPIGRLGPCLMLAHYHDLNEGLPIEETFIQKIIIPREEYEELLSKYNEHKTQNDRFHKLDEKSEKIEVRTEQDALKYIYENCPIENSLSSKISDILEGNLPLEDLPQEFKEGCIQVSSNLGFLDLSVLKLQLSLNKILPLGFLEAYQSIVVANDAKYVWLGVSQLPSIQFEDLAKEKLSWKFKEINFILCSTDQIALNLEEVKKRYSENTLIFKYDPASSNALQYSNENTDAVILDETKCSMIDPLDMESTPESIFQWVLYQSITRKASDIHIEQVESGGRVRIRVDGDLRSLLDISSGSIKALTMVCKNACRMRPNDFDNQDASFLVHLNNQIINVRVNAIPFRNSFQKLALRLLVQSTNKLAIKDLNIPDEQVQILRRCIARPQGLILVSGPTGEGKTTTLYAMLEELNKPEINIQTIEDPIERQINGINQTAVDLARGVTFGSVMRSIVRQDPDVILLGEIRDRETAELAIESSLTGHLVLTTIHANSSIKALARLYQLGVDPHLLANSLIILQAQRLVKRLCPKCKVLESENSKYYRAKGCRECSGSGFKGRLPIMEFFPVCEEVQEAISQKMPTIHLKRIFESKNYKNLYEQALERAKEGLIQKEDAQLYLENW